MSNTHRQDVIANNLANSETTGFSRDQTAFPSERLDGRPGKTASPATGAVRSTKGFGGGLVAMPDHIDFSQGTLTSTGRVRRRRDPGLGVFRGEAGRQDPPLRDGAA